MFDRVWGFLTGAKEGVQIDYPLDHSPAIQEVRNITSTIGVYDFVICPDRKEAMRVYRLLRNFDMQAITRSVMYQGKPCVKVWRVR